MYSVLQEEILAYFSFWEPFFLAGKDFPDIYLRKCFSETPLASVISGRTWTKVQT